MNMNTANSNARELERILRIVEAEVARIVLTEIAPVRGTDRVLGRTG